MTERLQIASFLGESRLRIHRLGGGLLGFGRGPAKFFNDGRQFLEQVIHLASVVYLLRLNRTAPMACSGDRPMAMSTWLGAMEPVVQAEPLLAQIPSRLSNSRMASASQSAKLRLLVLASRGSLAPLRVRREWLREYHPPYDCAVREYVLLLRLGWRWPFRRLFRKHHVGNIFGATAATAFLSASYYIRLIR